MNISNFPKEDTTPTVPTGYTARSATLDDLQACVDLFNLVSARDYGHTSNTVEDLRTEWTSPVFDLTANTRLVHDGDGTLVGYIEVHTKPAERIFIWGRVHPDHENNGLGTYLTQWGEGVAHKNLPSAQEGTQVLIHLAYKQGHAATDRLFTNLGYQPVRNMYRMWIDMDEAPSPVTLPDGFSFRLYRHPEDLRTVLLADEEAFRDHWGHVDSDFEELYKEVLHECDADNKFDPSLIFMVFHDETDEIAAYAVNRIEHYTHPEAGYIESLGVLRQYRKRGLGSALLKHTFHEMYQRGKRAVALGVDASSLTGAVRLYENAGMYAKETTAVYEKIIREGKSVMVTEANTDA